ncbi:hypothetical protein MRX96_050917 [Rhipicephalus microplus]
MASPLRTSLVSVVFCSTFSVINDENKRNFRLASTKTACLYKGKREQKRRKATSAVDPASPKPPYANGTSTPPSAAQASASDFISDAFNFVSLGEEVGSVPRRKDC